MSSSPATLLLHPEVCRGGIAEIGLRSVSQAAILRATPILLNLEPQIEVVNDHACMGLDQLEKNFPVLHRSTEEMSVMGHLKDAFFLTLDDVQLCVNDKLDGRQKRLSRLTNTTWYYVLTAGVPAGSDGHPGPGQCAHTLRGGPGQIHAQRVERERSFQQYADEDWDEEPRLWTRFCCLLLCLSLQLYHCLMKLSVRLERVRTILQDAADRVRKTSN
ncbi:hypothetical protein DPEC_G00146830 [Dallia pectoralis]|uniref:Uncharacterized protein n=1 Tax=Dallia pectoralis TaxID=75939 RepID=A0ACC2GP77_DALPE|nr:hypothetical protein DPEC_G00146830 [Dallia pectoralis]